uniref:ANF_receptor domain-containing protein n=1 Tax=Syphacia muris TaxID=451379 RepID=A0A0N5A8M9_9BILA
MHSEHSTVFLITDFLFTIFASTPQAYEVKFGFIFPVSDPLLNYQVGFAQSCGAVPLALERLEEENVLNGADFRYLFLILRFV